VVACEPRAISHSDGWKALHRYSPLP
jgi:hypothetical protein